MKNDIFKSIELIVMYEVSKILTSTLYITDSTLVVLYILENFLDMREGTVMLLDKKENIIKPFVSLGRNTKQTKSYKIGLDIVHKVIKSESPIIIHNISDDPQFSRNITLPDSSKFTYSYICIPIKDKNEMIGTLSVIFRRHNYFITFESATKLLSMICLLIGQSITLNNYINEEKQKIWNENLKLQGQLMEKHNLRNIIGNSKALNEISRIVHRVAQTSATVMIRGESGTGKELVAKAIHDNSTRNNQAFIKVNCTAIPENLLEAELFGHVKGSFTGASSDRVGRFELADKGTILLDEIGDIPLSTQAKLLRVLQERKFERVGSSKTVSVDVRVIASTNKNLEEAIIDGTFREDLYYRLNVVPISIPPIRDRIEDIPPLIDHFLDKFNKINGKKIKLSEETRRYLLGYHWPGNVREIENLIQRLVILASSELVESNELPCEVRVTRQNSKVSTSGIVHPARAYSGDLGNKVKNLEQTQIIEALTKCGWVKSRAAKLIGITTRQLDYRMQKYNIELQKPWK